MSFIYKICLLYPYWFLKTLIHWIFQFYKNIFCLHIDENKIERYEIACRRLICFDFGAYVPSGDSSGDGRL